MKRVLCILIACLALGLSCMCLAEGAMPEGDFLYMINVGKGDAIIIRASHKYYLIDCAKSGAWDYVEAALERFGITELEGVFLTHTDKDHSGGLKKLTKSDIQVNNWYASAYFTCAESDHPMVSAIKKLDAKVQYLKSSDSVDGLFTVLGPINADEDNEDNNSLVMRFDNGLVTVLLSGDMEGGEELDLMIYDVDFSCDIFKVPNHADDDVCKFMNLKDLGAKIALISTDPYDKPGTPDPDLLERLLNAGMEVYRTDFTENGILVTLDEQMNVTED